MLTVAPASDGFSLRGTLSFVALGLLGYALAIANGALAPSAFWLTAAALVIACTAFALPDREIPRSLRLFPLLLAAGLLVHAVSVHLFTPAGVFLRGGVEIYEEHHTLFAAVATLLGVLIAGPPSAQHWAMVSLLVLYLWLGDWLLQASPAPFIDVWVWHVSSFEALRKGLNPYGITMPNIYGGTQFYGEGVADARHVYIGYPYPPLTLLFGWLAHLVKDDYRYINLLAQAGTAALLYLARPTRMCALAIALFLFTPRDLFVLEQGWTEPQCALALAATVLCALRAPRALPWVFGVLLSIKQYFVLALPLFTLLIDSRDPRVLARFLLKALVVPVAVIGPFFLWDPAGVINSLILCQIRQPFRIDSLSVMAWLAQGGGPMLPLNIGLAAAAIAILIGLWRGERSPSGFVAALSLTLFVFFFFAKQAFANYYYMTLACLAATAATSLAPARPREGEIPPLM